jgi:hypothetical protein
MQTPCTWLVNIKAMTRYSDLKSSMSMHRWIHYVRDLDALNMHWSNNANVGGWRKLTFTFMSLLKKSLEDD